MRTNELIPAVWMLATSWKSCFSFYSSEKLIWSLVRRVLLSLTRDQFYCSSTKSSPPLWETDEIRQDEQRVEVRRTRTPLSAARVCMNMCMRRLKRGINCLRAGTQFSVYWANTDRRARTALSWIQRSRHESSSSSSSSPPHYNGRMIRTIRINFLCISTNSAWISAWCD